MGNQQSIGFDLSQYQFIGNQQQPSFGEGKLYQNNETGEIICLMERILDNNDQRQLKLQKLNHPNLLKIHYSQVNQDQELCSSFSKLTIVYEYANITFNQQIINRRNKQINFTQNQLWGLLYQSLNILNFLKQHEIFPMDLKNLLISNQGMIKFHSLKENKLSNYKQLVYNFTNDVHISPEELQCLEQRCLILNLDFEKCEIFQIGLTCLYAATLEDTNNLFDLTNYTYSKEQINQKIINLNYSEEYKNILKIMLSHSPQYRTTFQELITMIPRTQVDNNLLNLKREDYNLLNFQVQKKPIPYYPNPRHEPQQSHYIVSLQSNVPMSNVPISQIQIPLDNKPLHIATPEQSMMSKIEEQKKSLFSQQNYQAQYKSEPFIVQQSRPTLQTQNDENIENELFQQTNRESQQFIQQNPYYFSNLPNNIIQPNKTQIPTQATHHTQPKILQKNNQFSSNRSSQNFMNHIPPEKESFISQKSNKSQMEEKIEQAVRSSKIALRQFDNAIRSGQKPQQLYQ